MQEWFNIYKLLYIQFEHKGIYINLCIEDYFINVLVFLFMISLFRISILFILFPFGIIQHLLTTKTFNKIMIRGTFLRFSHYNKLTAHITVYWEKLKVFPLKSNIRLGCPFSLILFNTTEIRQEKERSHTNSIFRQQNRIQRDSKYSITKF